jgi:fibrillarin-like rRNA methylase
LDPAEAIRDAVCEYTGIMEGMEWTPDPRVDGVYAVHTDSGKEFLATAATRSHWDHDEKYIELEEVEFTQWPPAEAPGGDGAWKMELH